METSDYIAIAAIIASFVIAVPSIIISILTLRQNSKMIEESSRPYVTVYIDRVCFSEIYQYIVLKNFGSSAAEITGFTTNYDLKFLVPNDLFTPFEHIVGTFIAPNQSFKLPFNMIKVSKPPDKIEFQIKYRALKKSYNEQVTLNFSASSDLPVVRKVIKGNNLQVISYAIQDLVEKHI